MAVIRAVGHHGARELLGDSSSGAPSSAETFIGFAPDFSHSSYD
jgi:hypothetical protein